MKDAYALDREEGFKGAAARAPWIEHYAKWPTRLPYGTGTCWVWRVSYRTKEYSAFGITQREVEIL